MGSCGLLSGGFLSVWPFVLWPFVLWPYVCGLLSVWPFVLEPQVLHLNKSATDRSSGVCALYHALSVVLVD